jgi:anti-anti-sigma factor
VSLKATVSSEGDVEILSLSGFLDFETISSVRRTCLEILNNKKVVIDLTGLNFVGSSGISILLDTIREMSVNPNSRPKMAGLSSEFKRVFIAADLGDLELYSSGIQAALSYSNPTYVAAPVPQAFHADWSAEDQEIETELGAGEFNAAAIEPSMPATAETTTTEVAVDLPITRGTAG